MSRTDTSSVKREIVDAFMKLVKEKSYLDITVTDLINKANVARASFYRNFNSINDIIDIITDDLCESFIEDIYPTLSGNDERKQREFLFNYFYHFVGNKNKLAEIQPQNFSVFMSRIDSRMKLLESKLPEQTVRDKYVVHAKLGSINSIAKHWMNGGMKETPEEIINYIMSFMVSF